MDVFAKLKFWTHYIKYNMDGMQFWVLPKLWHCPKEVGGGGSDCRPNFLNKSYMPFWQFRKCWKLAPKYPWLCIMLSRDSDSDHCILSSIVVNCNYAHFTLGCPNFMFLGLKEWQQRPDIWSEDRSAAGGRRIWNEYFVSPTQPGCRCCCCSTPCTVQMIDKQAGLA